MGAVALPAVALTPVTAYPTTTNPVTGNEESVVQTLGTNVVLTENGNRILDVDAVGETFVLPGSADVYTVTAVTTNSSGKVISVEAENGTTNVVSSFDRVTDIMPSTVVNPDDGVTETIVKVYSLTAVLTNKGNMIMLPVNVGDIIYAPDSTVTYEVKAVQIVSGRVVSYDLDGSDGSTHTNVARVSDATALLALVPVGTDGTDATGGTTAGTTPAGDVNFVRTHTGATGGNGSDGGGVEICFGILGCLRIAYDPTSGGAGAPGKDWNFTLTAADLPAGETQLHTVTAKTPGIQLSSIGGTGGQGGDAYGNIAAAPGGTAGVGGTIILENHLDIVTSGEESHGIDVKSSAGKGGTGGTGYIASTGGGGGSAAQAGTVTVTNYGSIHTSGVGAIGIQAQSLGGSAGSGGDSYGLIGEGGGGSSGGNGNTVTVTNYGQIVTEKDYAHGILAQSIGGSGGNGGDGSGLIGFGSTGTAGGNGGQVFVSNEGLISTGGDYARGIFAQSIGGGGGTGGDGAGLGAIGGSGGKGSKGEKVTVSNSGLILTEGNQSAGIFAQSVGGGGGDGGTAGGPFLTIGGSGNSGGDGGKVSVNNTGWITTLGDDSHGIQAQSVGGGGGNGGASKSVSAFGGVAIGGKGGDGGKGETVSVTFSGQGDEGLILTEGERSRGIFAQSVGGGGGSGGLAAQVSVGLSGAVSLAIGGKGGKGGIGGQVAIGDVTGCLVAADCYDLVKDDLHIETQGDNSEGVYVQSVGGGGGAGGYAIAAAVSAGPGASISVSTAIGGSAGDGGAGGDVIVRTGGSIQTGKVDNAYVMHEGEVTTELRNSGEFSTGLMAQSVGGGGGKGGYSISAAVSVSDGVALSLATGVGGTGGGGGGGGTVDVDFNGSIDTLGDDAAGAIIQSVGGGGGSGGFNISASIAAAGGVGGAGSIGVGGSGGTGGAGGSATGVIGGDVTTTGDRSTGVLVQSVGGGGGNGGYNISGSIGAAGAVGVGIAVGVGGGGAGGGIGGRAEGTTLGQITTSGDNAGGLLVQSVGGGGGNGGFNISGSIGAGGTVGGAISVGVGGSAGTGSGGGYAEGHAEGLVLTSGNNAAGVTVQSLGGGGGNGGFSIAGGIGGGGTAGGAISVSLGGNGGAGGDGGEVHGFASSIGTVGENSGGFLAQSVGGGGGNGGFSIGAGIGGGGTGGGAISVSLGGSGSTGGHGGYVEGRVSDLVSTTGERSTAVTVQSLGGGGGNGGFSVAGGIGGGGTGGGAISVGLGGSGGGAGHGGEVDASAASIITTNDFSGGFLAQSVGGGGGNGGFAVAGSIGAGGTGGGAVSVGIGGSGAGGGMGKRVGATVTGNVVTGGKQSDAIVAQSLGGGGGNGGFSVAGGIGVGGTGGGAVSVGIGGSAGDGGNSGKVTLGVTGRTDTYGTDSNGIIAQSIGGGGGNGGFSVAGNIAAGGTGAGAVGVSIGGSGGDGGDTGLLETDDSVQLDVTGETDAVTGETIAVVTRGVGSRAVLAQSVGGGGGNGGFSVSGSVSLAKQGAGNIGVGVGGSGGDGGFATNVEGNVTGDVYTLGDSDAAGILVQSIGGGGGNGGFNVTGGIAASTKGAGNLLVGVGGMGGDGGVSGEVTGTVTGNVFTRGTNSAGVTYQSLAGGGGNGGFNITGGIALTSSSSGGAGNIGVGVGGFGGNASNAKRVDATVIGNITTLGDKSYGALLQSVGGGGGNGGFNVTGTFQASAANGGGVGFGLGGFGGDGGAASTVTGVLTGDVYTTGDDAYGAMLQSLGGGGGNGGFNVSASATLTSGDNGFLGVGIGGFGGKGGASEKVHGTITGDYYTEGANAGGIIVQSLGGGGGNGGLNVTGQLSVSTKGNSGQASVGIGGFGGDGGNAGEAWLVRTGDTQTAGVNSQAILVQSVGGGGGNGGVNVTGGLVASKSDNATINIGLGGFGGKASYAQAVNATILGNVWATGLGDDDAESPLFTGAVVAQSVGGGGGTGGLNVSGGLSLTKSGGSGKAASIGIGGFAGDGGDAGTVDLVIGAPSTDRVEVVAAGNNRAAVVAQSLGGGGGIGGISISGGVSTNSALAVGIGGFGGDGGMGKTVTVGIDADISTTGDGTRGIVAQSLGGGGGAGGINISGTANLNSNDDTSITFGLGGFGGAGNISGRVDVTQNGLVSVTGENGIGILAQSVAGGGGDGGLNVSANIANASANKTTKRITAGIGGFAGDAADAGEVVVNSVGDIFIDGPASTSPDDNPGGEETTVFNAGGILAQSIGGGGGLGGMNVTASAARNAGNTLQFGMGGNGGAGGHAGNVTVVRGYDAITGAANASMIVTEGDYSAGLMAQSVGGGGGQGGMNFNFAYNNEPKAEEDDSGNKKHVAAVISVGGSGADAGDGKIVTVRHNGDIYTDGVSSHGLVAQSVGGGGGGSNINLGAGALGDKTTGVNIGVGGANGAAGVGGLVDVDHVGTIYTHGNASMGIKAQSIGGGGGSVSTLNKYVDPILDVLTGNLDGSSLTVNIGREGGSGGTGGEVRVKSEGEIFTDGDDSIGIFAQSVGGGGGDSGTTTIGGDYSAENASYGGNIAVGLDGGDSATGDKVTVTSTSIIETLGDRAHAIFAQSLGGGGGMGGTVGDKLSLNTGDDEDTTSASLSIGGKGGAGSFSQLVTVTNFDILATWGDYSSGIWAQSIGGSGGNGGDYLQANIQNIKSEKTARSFALNIGGTGGTGAVGGGVTVTNKGLIQTLGIQSFGIRAESIGGGGGDGGAVSQGTLQTGNGSKQSVDINVGGKGGTGGAGGEVKVTNEGAIVTAEMGAEGIRATSTGGGGGNAGVMINTLVTATGSAAQTQSVAMNIGGNGGTGGTGGAVTVDNTRTAGEETGLIWTGGDAAHGIFAQSLGGGGGNGSSIITMTGLKSSKDSFAVGLNFGGAGGSGNTAGTVTVTNSGIIETDGDNAYGILAQSTGGGGGNGGLVLSASAAFGAKANAPVLSIGGAGGDGGDGGAVKVTNTGSILTLGENSHGVVAQSIGGGGGNAGIGIAATNNLESLVVSNVLSLIVGAVSSGTGGTGGEVEVTQSGDITVLGEGARAIVAESINGGGGHLDFDLSGIVGMSGFSFKENFKEAFGYTDADVVVDPEIATRLGGVDLTDMNASKVKVNSTGTYGVGGDNGVGSFLQSLGGGGGTLHLKTVQASADAVGAGNTPTAIAYSVELGGKNGVNNSGAGLEGERTGYILTTGVNSLGLLSQTIGGGGGHAIIDITKEAGALVGPIVLTFGGSNGTGEMGGDILRFENGAVTTTEDLSSAIVVQSIGGGGGFASIVVHEPPSLLAVNSAPKQTLSGQTIQPVAAAPVGAVPAPVSLSFGAAGGTGLDGGDITSTYSGGASTIGDHALGLIIQSIGAGGGAAVVGGDAPADVTLGGSLGASGNGGALTITSPDEILTEGAGSHGIVLQSIGGGGGAVFGNGAGSNVTLNAANTGNGGAISLGQSSAVITLGEGAHGVVAQSLGGGGGWIDGLFAGTAGGSGQGGTIHLGLDAGVIATGAGSTAVWAQSLGSLGGDDITIDAAGMVRGDVAGISLDGGAANTVTTSGSVSAVSALAISATGGDDAILNDGAVIGNVDLGAGANSFTNRLGSTFIAYSTIDLFDPATPGAPPAGSTFSNSGDFLMGLDAPRIPIDLENGAMFDNLDAQGDPETNLLYGARVINTVALDGNFVQTDDGHLAFDVAFGPYASDRVNVSGTATVAGTGTVILTALGNADPVTLFAAAGGGVDNGLEIEDTLAMDYRVLAGSQGIQLAFTHNFAQPFLNRNGNSLAGHLNSAIELGDSDGLGRTLALLGNLRVGEELAYATVIDELNPESFVTPLIAQYAGSERFSRDLFGCLTAAGMASRSCVWGHVESNSMRRTPDGESFAASSWGQSLSTGFERPLNDQWSVTVAVGYDRIESLIAADGRAQSDGQSLELGAGLRRVMSNGADLSLSLSGGWQTLDTQRLVSVFEPEIGTSKPETTYMKAAMSVGKTYRYKQVYARPTLNLTATSLSQKVFREQGLGGIGVVGLDHSQTIYAAEPELAVGYISDPRSSYINKLEVTAGRSYRDVSRVAMPYRLAGANGASDPALISTFIGRTSDNFGASFEVINTEKQMSLRLSFNSEASAKLRTSSLGATLKMKF